LHDDGRRDARAVGVALGDVRPRQGGVAHVTDDHGVPSESERAKRAERETRDRDELPAELDISGYVGPTVFPSSSRRRAPGVLYSADDPPSKRGIVLVDGVAGTVTDHFVEDNPEHWT